MNQIINQALAEFTPQFGLPGAPAGSSVVPVNWIVTFYKFLFGLGVVATIISIIVSGIMYIFAGASTTLIHKAKKRFYMSLIGLLILLLSNFLINQINPEILTPKLVLYQIKSLQTPPSFGLPEAEFEISSMAAFLVLLAAKPGGQWDVNVQKYTFPAAIKGAIAYVAKKYNTSTEVIIKHQHTEVENYAQLLLLSALIDGITNGQASGPVGVNDYVVRTTINKIKNTLYNIKNKKDPKYFNAVTTTVGDIKMILNLAQKLNVGCAGILGCNINVSDNNVWRYLINLNVTSTNFDNDPNTGCMDKNTNEIIKAPPNNCDVIDQLEIIMQNITTTPTNLVSVNQVSDEFSKKNKKIGIIKKVFVLTGEGANIDYMNLEALFMHKNLKDGLVKALDWIPYNGWPMYNLQITEAFPPGTDIHQDIKHYNGRAIDISYKELINRSLNVEDAGYTFGKFLSGLADRNNKISTVLLEVARGSTLYNCLKDIFGQRIFDSTNEIELNSYTSLLTNYFIPPLTSTTCPRNYDTNESKFYFHMMKAISNSASLIDTTKIKFGHYPHVVGEPLHVESY